VPTSTRPSSPGGTAADGPPRAHGCYPARSETHSLSTPVATRIHHADDFSKPRQWPGDQPHKEEKIRARPYRRRLLLTSAFSEWATSRASGS
jgi:hypothetical protein